jgi:ABC-type branched-subunit amino acid transport system ATPase component
LGEVVNEHSRQIWAADESVILVEYKVDICSQECDLVVALTSEDIIIPGTPVVNVK